MSGRTAASAGAKNASGGYGLGVVLFAVFLTLKLTGVVDWSWWLVTAPLWLPIAFTVGFLLAVGLVALIVWAIKQVFGR